METARKGHFLGRVHSHLFISWWVWIKQSLRIYSGQLQVVGLEKSTKEGVKPAGAGAADPAGPSAPHAGDLWVLIPGLIPQQPSKRFKGKKTI